MSQIRFTAPSSRGPVEVVGGWDVPLRYFHLTVYSATKPGVEEEAIWCNLDQISAFPRDNKGYKGVLADLLITPPPGFWEEVEKREDGGTIKVWDGKTWAQV